MFDLHKLVRPNIASLQPYSCARDEFKGEARAFLDANENPYNAPYNRYPDPRQTALKAKIALLKGVRPEQILLGNGSDEPIDLVYRVFCEPGKDNVVAIHPTYGMYSVCADINQVAYRPVVLNEQFDIDEEALLSSCDAHTKVIWCCSPNNPTANVLSRNRLENLLQRFIGLVVIDEAYVDFSSESSWLDCLNQYPNLIVLQTFSKAWGLASVRCGMAFAHEAIIALFNKVKYPYNINLLTQQFVSARIDCVAEKEAWVQQILQERPRVEEALRSLPIVKTVYPSDANFVLVQVQDANATYRYLVNQRVVVRNRHTVALCGNCLRITIGTPQENHILIDALQKMP